MKGLEMHKIRGLLYLTRGPSRALLREHFKMYTSLASLALILSALPSTLALPRPRSNSQCVNPAVRKEWRSLTTAEQADFVQATSVGLPVKSFPLFCIDNSL